MKRKTIDRQFFTQKNLPKKRRKNSLNFMLVFLKTKQILSFFYNLNSYLKQKTIKLYIL